MKQTTLEKLPFGMEISVSQELSPAYIQDMIMYRIRGYVWAQDAGKPIEVKYPADWWQAFKLRWLKFLPVRYTVKTFRVKATYPDLNIQGHEPVLRLLEYTDEWPPA